MPAREHIDSHLAAVGAMRDMAADIDMMAGIAADCMARGGKLLACGNGGSAADAQHLVAELVGRFRAEREGLPAIALSADPATFSALGNDYGFEAVFARQVEAQGRPGDVLVAISTSGNSENVLRAAQAGNRLGLVTLALTGRGGGRLAETAQHTLPAPADATDLVQECHGLLVHILAGAIERRLFS